METTTTTPSTAKIALKYGALSGLCLMIYQIILYTGQLDTVTALTLLTFIIPIVGIVLAIKNFREQNGNQIRYGQGLGLGTLTAAVAGVLIAFFETIYLFYIDTSVLRRRIDYMVERLERSNVSGEMIDKIVEGASQTGPGQTFISNVFSYLIFGFIVSLIVAAVMKKEKGIFEE